MELASQQLSTAQVRPESYRPNRPAPHGGEPGATRSTRSAPLRRSWSHRAEGVRRGPVPAARSGWRPTAARHERPECGRRETE